MLPFIFFAVRGIFSFQDSHGDSQFAGLVPLRNLGILGQVVIPGIAYLVVAGVLVLNVNRIVSVALQMKMLTILGCLSICSALWSQDPLRSFYNGLFYLAGTLFAFYLVVRFDPEDIMTLVMMTGTLLCLGGLLAVVFVPHIAVHAANARMAGAWRGLFFDRTSAAKCLVYLLSPALVVGYGRPIYRRMAYCLLVGIFIIKAYAVTALVVVTGYAVFMTTMYLVRWLERRTALLVGMVTTLFCIGLVCASIPLLPEMLRLMGRDPTLTGRTEVWSALVPSILKQPLLGYGFYSFWLGVTGESANVITSLHWFFGYAHNGLLEIVLQLGLVGLVVFLVTLGQAIKDAWVCIRLRRSIGVEWYVGIIVLVVLYNVDEATVVLPNDLLSILYVVSCCGLSMAAGRLKAGGRGDRPLPA
jgi:O-antigen ligase